MYKVQVKTTDPSNRYWMPLPEAVAEVKDSLDCSAEGAKEALLGALRDGLVRARAMYKGGFDAVAQESWYRDKIEWEDGVLTYEDVALYGDPFPANAVNVEVQSTDLSNWIHKWFLRSAHGDEKERSKGGRPRWAHWDEFWIELAIIVEKNGFPGPENDRGWSTKSDLVNHMLEWCSLQYKDNSPSLTSVRNRVSDLYRELHKNH